ncbi:hypothetical protein [Tenacibaculum sp. 190524A05c]|uniref:hypothetical protein n=1 Tax=Tenacibaculum platacis TaxID=3137852 RepID=UPI0031FAC3AF
MKLLQIIKKETEVFMERLQDMVKGQKLRLNTIKQLEKFSEISDKPTKEMFDVKFESNQFVITKL